MSEIQVGVCFNLILKDREGAQDLIQEEGGRMGLAKKGEVWCR